MLWVIAGACALGFSAAFMFTKAASRSPLANIGFAVALAVVLAALVAVGFVGVVRALFPNLY